MSGNIPGGNFLGGNCSEESLMGGSFPGEGNFPRTGPFSIRQCAK